MIVAVMFHRVRSGGCLRLQRQRIWLVYELVLRDPTHRLDTRPSKGLLILDIDLVRTSNQHEPNLTSRCPPTEAKCLADDILFFPPVSGAYKSYRKGNNGELFLKFLQSKRNLSLHQTMYADRPVSSHVAVDLWYCTMIPHEMQVSWGQESLQRRSQSRACCRKQDTYTLK